MTIDRKYAQGPEVTRDYDTLQAMADYYRVGNGFDVFPKFHCQRCREINVVPAKVSGRFPDLVECEACGFPHSFKASGGNVLITKEYESPAQRDSEMRRIYREQNADYDSEGDMPEAVRRKADRAIS